MRKTRMRTVLLCGLLALAGCRSPADTEPVCNNLADSLWTRKNGVDWPCFLGPTHDSVSTEKGIIPWPKDGLKLVWETILGEGYAPPTVANGRLYHFDRFGDAARLTCRNAETGERLWKFEYPTKYVDLYNYSGGPRCCPIIDEDRIYLHGVDGVLLCLKATDGTEIWQHNTVKEFNIHQNFFGVGSTPIVEGDLLIVGVGGSPPGAVPDDFRKVKGNGTGIIAFDKKTGDIRYRITDELASYSSPTVATINGRRWCFYLARTGLVGFEPTTGKVDFQFPWRARLLESVNAANPIVIGDQVLITETYGPGAALLKVSPGKHEVVWSDEEKDRNEKSMQCHWNTPIHVDGYVYGSSGRHENADLRCMELATGKMMWDEGKLSRSSLMLVDGHFVCLTEDGVLLLLKVNPKKFDLVSRWELPEIKTPAWAAPVLSHGLLYIRGKDRLMCFELIRE